MELHIIGHSGRSSIGAEQISDFRYDEMGVFLDRGCKSNGALKLRRVSCVSGRSQKGVRRDKAALSSGCKPHPAKSLPPEAIGAVMEVTKWLKPSISVSRIGDSASGLYRAVQIQATRRRKNRPPRRSLARNVGH